MKLVSYLTTPLPGALERRDQLRLVLGAFAATASSVIVVHQFLPGGQQFAVVVTHSTVIAAAYTAAMVLVGGSLFWLARRTRRETLDVWELWALSFVVFNVGYFLDIPVGEESRVVLHQDVGAEKVWLHYGRLVPIWALMTYGFVEARARRALAAKLASGTGSATESRLEIICGKKRIRLDTKRVSHIDVEDHYCYVHYDGAAGWRRIDVALPLHEVLRRFPDSFLRVHRSHVVNLAHVDRLEREGRGYRLVLRSGIVVPVSRHRMGEVLPIVRAFLD